MKKIILLQVIIIVISCNYGTKKVIDSDDLKIENGGIIADTFYLKQILPPINHNGERTEYSAYLGKFIHIKITNRTSKVVYLYSKANAQYPIDSLWNRSIYVDSALVTGVYYEVVSSEIQDNFDTLNDSVLPYKTTNRLLFLKKEYKHIKGFVPYVIKSASGVVQKKQFFMF